MSRRDVVFAALGILVVWQIGAMIIARPILPSPLIVLDEFWRELFREMPLHFLASFWRVTAAMLISVVVAAPAGLIIGGSKSLDRIFSPVIYLLYPIPKVVFVPILFLILGIGDIAKIAIIFIILFFQILVLVRDQAAGLANQLLQSIRSLGAGRRALFRYVYLPASLPAILTALRQSVGIAVAVLYIAESTATRMGLGYYIIYNGTTLFNYPAMYAGVLAMSLLGLGLYFAVDWLERRLCPWKYVS